MKNDRTGVGLYGRLGYKRVAPCVRKICIALQYDYFMGE